MVPQPLGRLCPPALKSRPASARRREGVWYDRAVAFARWDPIHDLLAIHQRLDRFAPGQGGWTPPVDIHETADAYVVIAEIPGLGQDDLRIGFHDGQLTLAGTRREQGACEQYHRMERGHGSFSRTFQLPLPVDEAGIVADLRDGVLKVTCPKTDPATRRVHIS